MIDTSTSQPIRVSTDAIGESYIRLPASQMEAVAKLLRDNDLSHWLDHHVVSVNGQPPVGMIYLTTKADP